MNSSNGDGSFTTNSSVDKAFAILEYLAEKNTRQSVPKISYVLKFNKSTTYSILRTLEYHSYVFRHSDGCYSLTSKLLELGSKFTMSNPASRVFELCSMPARTRFPNCNVSLAAYGSYYNGTFLNIIGENAMYFSVGSTFPLYATASGKVLLAWSSDRYLEEFWEKATLTKFTDNTVVDRSELEMQFKQIRADGYAYLKGELYSNLHCVAVPVFMQNKKIVAAASITGARGFMKENFEEIKDETIALGIRISEALGYGKGLT